MFSIGNNEIWNMWKVEKEDTDNIWTLSGISDFKINPTHEVLTFNFKDIEEKCIFSIYNPANAEKKKKY